MTELGKFKNAEVWVYSARTRTLRLAIRASTVDETHVPGASLMVNSHEEPISGPFAPSQHAPQPHPKYAQFAPW